MSSATYLLIALLMMLPDALLCYALKKRLRIWRLIPFALLWPVTLPFTLIACAVVTRNHPDSAP